MNFDRSRFKSLVHYICTKCPDPTKLGATKLNKILWFSDTLFYLNHGRPITGETYVKRNYGPVPQNILSVLAELEAEGALEIRETNFHGLQKREFLATGAADPSPFSPEELTLIDDVIDEITNQHTATSISELSHMYCWEAAADSEPIPYHALFAYRRGEITDKDVAWAQKMIRENPEPVWIEE